MDVDNDGQFDDYPTTPDSEYILLQFLKYYNYIYTDTIIIFTVHFQIQNDGWGPPFIQLIIGNTSSIFTLYSKFIYSAYTIGHRYIIALISYLTFDYKYITQSKYVNEY